MEPEGSLVCSQFLTMIPVLGQINAVHTFTPYFFILYEITSVRKEKTEQNRTEKKVRNRRAYVKQNRDYSAMILIDMVE
jgi:hypothetical protein